MIFSVNLSLHLSERKIRHVRRAEKIQRARWLCIQKTSLSSRLSFEAILQFSTGEGNPTLLTCYQTHMSFLPHARETVEDQLLPVLESRLDQKIGGADKFYVQRKLRREDIDEQDRLFLSLADPDTSATLQEKDLLQYGNYVVLGSSGAGKSVMALRAALVAYRRFLAENDAPFPIFLELGTEMNQGDSQAVRDTLQWASSGLFDSALQEHEPGLHLIIDALDELLRYERRMLAPLETVLMELNQRKNLQLLLTTRRSQWRESDWKSRLLRNAEIYHVDEAGRYEYRQILGDDEEWADFCDVCKSRGLDDLLDTPFDGFDLAFRFRNGEELPSDRREHLNKRINERLRKNASSVIASVSRSRLRELAGMLACVMSFDEKDSFKKREAVDALGGSALGDVGKEATSDEVERLLASRLFRTVRSGVDPEYAFDHVLYREALASECLTSVSLRKQRLLICVQLDGRERVAAVHRGIARMLAERDEAFRSHLLVIDSPVALFSSLPSLSGKGREELLRSVFDWAVDQHIPPWANVEGAGESFQDVLTWHQLPAPSDFLRPYLTSDHEIAKLWAAHAAGSWGEVSGVREELKSIALDSSEHRSTRRECVRALHQSCGSKALPTIERLLYDDSDPVRGTALRAYLDLAKPAPVQFLILLQKPKQQPNLSSSLQRVVRSYGQSLSNQEVESILRFLHVLQWVIPSVNPDEEAPAITGLYAQLLGGILERDDDLVVTDAPIIPVLFRALRRGKVVFGERGEVQSDPVVYKDTLVDFLQSRQDLWCRLFLYAYDRIDSGNAGDFLHGRPYDILAASATDSSFNFFPSPTPPSWRQKSLLRDVRRQVLPSSDLGGDLMLPLSVPEEISKCLRSAASQGQEDQELTSLRVERAFQAALDASGPGAKTRRVLEVVARFKNPHPDFWKRVQGASSDQLRRAAEGLPKWAAHLSPSVYRKLIEVLETPAQNELSSSKPFQPWVPGVVKFLCEDGDHLSVIELASAFHNFGPYHSLEDAGYYSSRIREKSVPRWRSVIQEAFHTESVRPQILLGLLSERDEDFLLSEVRQRLEKGMWSRRQFHSLLDYYLEYAIQEEEITSTLRRCLQILCLRQWGQLLLEQNGNGTDIEFRREDVFRLLSHLMNESHEEAWSIFQSLLDRGTVPMRRRHRLERVGIPTPQSLDYTRILKDWYVRIRQSIDRDGDIHREKKHLADSILSKITDYGGVDVLHMLRTVQSEAPYEDASWLSGTIMDLESQILSESAEQRNGPSVLRMITTDRYHDVQSENDLFEATREAIESLNEDFRSGDSIAGFWNTGDDRTSEHEPKHEAECQNVLWPLLSQCLANYGVRGIEEEVINENFADFRIDYPRANQDPLSTFVELKVARKGYGASELVDPIENQLYDEHLRPSGCMHGIFAVLWFKDPERYNHPASWADIDILRNDIRAKAEEVQSRYGVTIAPYVLDMTAGYRER